MRKLICFFFGHTWTLWYPRRHCANCEKVQINIAGEWVDEGNKK